MSYVVLYKNGKGETYRQSNSYPPGKYQKIVLVQLHDQIPPAANRIVYTSILNGSTLMASEKKGSFESLCGTKKDFYITNESNVIRNSIMVVVEPCSGSGNPEVIGRMETSVTFYEDDLLLSTVNLPNVVFGEQFYDYIIRN
jgi:hypothetical protein